MTQLGAAPQRVNDELCDGLVLKKPRPPLRPVRVTIHPDESPPGRQVMRSRVLSLGANSHPDAKSGIAIGPAGKCEEGGDENPYKKSVPERAKISRALLQVPSQASARLPTWHARVRA